jgi:hypothetical protein
MPPNMVDTPSPTRLRDPLRRGLCAGLAGLGLLAGLPARAEDGAALAQRVHERPAGRDLSTISRMELTQRGRAPRVREMATYRQDRGSGEVANLLRFMLPEDIAGTGLLSLDKADGSTDQWLYLPELDRVRRIAGDRRSGRFVGSDLLFEDLQERKPALDVHRIVGRETVAGVPCQVLESVPREAASSVYTRRLSWVDAETAMVLRVDYFGRAGDAPTKRWELAQRQRIQGYWTVTDSRMTDLGSGHETRMIVSRSVYDRRLPARLFHSRALADEQFESEFRL